MLKVLRVLENIKGPLPTVPFTARFDGIQGISSDECIEGNPLASMSSIPRTPSIPPALKVLPVVKLLEILGGSIPSLPPTPPEFKVMNLVCASRFVDLATTEQRWRPFSRSSSPSTGSPQSCTFPTRLHGNQHTTSPPADTRRSRQVCLVGHWGAKEE